MLELVAEVAEAAVVEVVGWGGAGSGRSRWLTAGIEGTTAGAVAKIGGSVKPEEEAPEQVLEVAGAAVVEVAGGGGIGGEDRERDRWQTD